MNNVLKWSAGVLGCVLIVALIVFLVVKTVGSNNVTETAPAVPVENDKLDNLTDLVGTLATQVRDLQNKPEPAPAVPTEITQALTTALAGITTRLDELEKKPAPTPVLASSTVKTVYSATNPVPGAVDAKEYSERVAKMWVDHGDPVPQSKSDAEFQLIFMRMGEPRIGVDPEMGVVSAVILKGGPSSPHGVACMGGRPPMAVPKHWGDFAQDSTGAWVAINPSAELMACYVVDHEAGTVSLKPGVVLPK